MVALSLTLSHSGCITGAGSKKRVDAKKERARNAGAAAAAAAAAAAVAAVALVAAGRPSVRLPPPLPPSSGAAAATCCSSVKSTVALPLGRRPRRNEKGPRAESAPATPTARYAAPAAGAAMSSAAHMTAGYGPGCCGASRGGAAGGSAGSPRTHTLLQPAAGVALGTAADVPHRHAVHSHRRRSLAAFHSALGRCSRSAREPPAAAAAAAAAAPPAAAAGLAAGSAAAEPPRSRSAASSGRSDVSGSCGATGSMPGGRLTLAKRSTSPSLRHSRSAWPSPAPCPTALHAPMPPDWYQRR